MKFTIAFLKARKRWRLDYRLNGVRHRTTFRSKELAESEKSVVLGQVNKAGAQWVALTAHERDDLMALHADAKRDGFALREAVNYYRQTRHMPAQSITLVEVYNRFIKEKEGMRLSNRSIKALRSNVGRFIRGRETLGLTQIKRDDILQWLQQPEFSPRTFNTYRVSLGTFFKWCVTTELLAKSPTSTIPKIGKKQMPDIDEPPHILNIDQCKALLAATLATDKGLVPYVAVCLFAGLRPDKEAGKLSSGDITADIFVCGLHAKDRQRRHVDIRPTLKAWLDLGGDLPPKNLRRRFEKVRLVAGLITIEKAVATGRGKNRVVTKVDGKWIKKITSTGWDQDCLRHTFASCYLPIHGAEKTIAQLGHGDYEMLFSHYRNLVKREVAEAFWGLTPEMVSGRTEP